MNKLGFGFLRLPVTPAGEIDLSLLDQMTDVFLAHGQNYFDTAYTYLDGKSEWAIQKIGGIMVGKSCLYSFSSLF